MRMFPRLPNFRPDDIPGCLLEAVVVLMQTASVTSDRLHFNSTATEAGLIAQLRRHPDDT
jgi:hypothetical protein